MRHLHTSNHDCGVEDSKPWRVTVGTVDDEGITLLKVVCLLESDDVFQEPAGEPVTASDDEVESGIAVIGAVDRVGDSGGSEGVRLEGKFGDAGGDEVEVLAGSPRRDDVARTNDGYTDGVGREALDEWARGEILGIRTRENVDSQH